MNIYDLSETGVNTVISGILAGCESYLKANRQMKGPYQDEQEFTAGNYDFFATLRLIRAEMIRAQKSGLPLRENILVKYAKWLNDLDMDGAIGGGWRDEFGLEIFR